MRKWPRNQKSHHVRRKWPSMEKNFQVKRRWLSKEKMANLGQSYQGRRKGQSKQSNQAMKKFKSKEKATRSKENDQVMRKWPKLGDSDQYGILTTLRQRWHNILLIYRKTRSIGTFSIIFIVSLSYWQTKIALILYRYRIMNKLEVNYCIVLV